MTNAEARERARTRTSHLRLERLRGDLSDEWLLAEFDKSLNVIDDLASRLEQAEKEKAEWREEAISMAITASEIAEDHGESVTVADLDQSIAEFKERT